MFRPCPELPYREEKSRKLFWKTSDVRQVELSWIPWSHLWPEDIHRCASPWGFTRAWEQTVPTGCHSIPKLLSVLCIATENNWPIASKKITSWLLSTRLTRYNNNKITNGICFAHQQYNQNLSPNSPKKFVRSSLQQIHFPLAKEVLDDTQLCWISVFQWKLV